MISTVKEFVLSQKVQVGESVYVVKDFPTRSMICLECKLPAVGEPSYMKIGISDLRKLIDEDKASIWLPGRRRKH